LPISSRRYASSKAWLSTSTASSRRKKISLLASAAVLKVKLKEALRERDDALEQLNRADVPAPTQAKGRAAEIGLKPTAH
jgi:hypothetical protein